MTFFRQFPKAQYDLKKDGNNIEIRDFFRFVDVNSKLIDPASAYSNYFIQDGDRPDNVSHTLYKDVDFYWTFFIVNDFLKDGYKTWPKSYRELELQIERKYTPYAVLEASPPDNARIGNFNASPKQIYIGFASDSPTGSWSPALAVGQFYKIDSEKFQVWVQNPTDRLTNFIKHSKSSPNGLRPELRLYTYDSPDTTLDSPTTTFRRGWQYAWQAPIQYQSGSDTPITFYEALHNGSTNNPLTYQQFEADDNDSRRQIRVVKSEYISQFAELYEEFVRENSEDE